MGYCIPPPPGISIEMIVNSRILYTMVGNDGKTISLSEHDGEPWWTVVLRGTVCRFKQNHMDSWVNEANYRVGFKQLSTTQNLVHKGESETISRETNSIQFKSVKLQKATISPIRFITWVQYMPAHIP